jgi:hypothetical protein
LTLTLLKVNINIVKGGDRMNVLPEWMANLEDEDLVFIKKFVLASGSLKEIATHYGVTYPTVRLRLDKIIDKVLSVENQSKDPYINVIRRLAVNEKIDLDTAKTLIAEYKKTRGRNLEESEGSQ